jgi:protease-4
MGDVAASGAYYTAAAADKIVANPGTLTASIGVILHAMNLESLLKGKLGVEPVTIKSGKFKDILSPYRKSTPEEIALLQNLIDVSYRQFLQAVIDGRTKGITDPVEKAARIRSITAVADGRVVVGEDALKVGLVDELGGLNDAKATLQKLAAKRYGIDDPESLTLQEYETPFGFFEWLGIAAKGGPYKLEARVKTGTDEFLPMSLRYANQPLWLMESLH